MSKASKWYAYCFPGEKFPNAWQPLPDARRVKIAGWEEFDLCVHRVMSARVRLMDGSWRVTEGRSGYALTSYYETRREAIEAATNRLKHVGKERFSERVQQCCAATGLSPRYAGERSEPCSETPKTI